MRKSKTAAYRRTGLLAAAALISVFGILIFNYGDQATVGAKGLSAPALSPSATFPANAGTLGAIPDGGSPCPTPGAPRNVTFTVGGMSGSVTNVSVAMTFSPAHTFVGDVIAVLIAPDGTTSHVLFGRTGATTAGGFGFSADLAGPYTFSDSAAGTNWWTAAATNPVPSGTYRTTPTGGAGATNPPAPTNMNAAFAGVADANGTWTLRLTDGCSSDTGSISAASLTIETGPSVPVDANADFDGDGKTDYAVARGTLTPLAEAVDAKEFPGFTLARNNYAGLDERPAPGTRPSAENTLAPPIYWYVRNSSTGNTLVYQNGDAATDYITPEDFDGDGKDDIVVWTEAPATQAAFKILQSSTNTVRVEFFGQTGDDPAVVGDYDGDGRADPAVYRCPPFDGADGQCYFFYRGSLNNPGQNITYVPWGFGTDGDYFPYVGDMDGDGKHDFCVQRANPASPANGQFVLLRSSDGGVEWINWGLSSDFLIPGDYDGDGKTDLMVRRTVGGQRQHWLLTRTGATSFFVWGMTGDVSVPGDYDGDGKTDYAIWRGSSTPGQSRFWVHRSSNSTVEVFTFGQCATVATCDFPVAGWAVH